MCVIFYVDVYMPFVKQQTAPRYKTRPVFRKVCISSIIYSKEEFESVKGVIRICKSKKDRQHNCQKKKDKRTNNDIQNTTQKTKDRALYKT